MIMLCWWLGLIGKGSSKLDDSMKRRGVRTPGQDAGGGQRPWAVISPSLRGLKPVGLCGVNGHGVISVITMGNSR